ncbi:MAG: hypothetical protein AAB477_01880 [Patescibacteria group bacterium]
MKESFSPTNSENSRKEFIKKITALGIGAFLMPKEIFSEPSQESQEQNRGVETSVMKEMEGHGNLPDGFYRSKINIKFEGEKEIEGAGSFFSIEDKQKAKVDFLSNKEHPEFFAGGVDFEGIERYYKSQGKEIVLVVAGAYYAPRTKDIEGIALEKGKTVGQDQPKSGSNGLLVMKDGNPEIQYVNQIPDFTNYINELKSENASAFQQTSYLRPGGQFSSSNPTKWELRFFVEGETNGKPQKGVLNFSTPMTYTEAVEAMKEMKGFTITKAIGLDTGNMSEGYFYDKNNGKNLMIDEQVGKHRNEYTNIIVFFSKP